MGWEMPETIKGPNKNNNTMHFHFTLLGNSQFTQQIIELFHVDIKKYDQLIFIGGGGGFSASKHFSYFLDKLIETD